MVRWDEPYGQVGLALISSNISGNKINTNWKITKFQIPTNQAERENLTLQQAKEQNKIGYPQSGRQVILITLKNSNGDIIKRQSFYYVLTNIQSRQNPEPTQTKSVTIDFNKQNYPDGIINLTGQLHGFEPSWRAISGTEAATMTWSVPINIQLSFQPAVTEEVEIEAEPGITLDSIVSGITQAVTIQEAAAQEEFKTKWYMVTFPSGKIEERKVSQKFIDTMSARGWKFEPIIDEPIIDEPPPTPPPEQKETWWVTKPSGIIEQLTVTQKFVHTMTAQGWIFSKDKPVIPPPTVPTPTVPTPTVPTPTVPTIDTSTSLTMISQKWDYFDIVDGRAKGQITFRATSDFNPYYYGKELVNYLQLVNNQGVTIVLKPNVLRFTQTETDETIQYDEGVGDLKSLKVESYVWTHDNQPMSSLYTFPIYEGKPPGTGTGELARTDFLAKMGGVLAGSIAIALLLPKRIGK